MLTKGIYDYTFRRYDAVATVAPSISELTERRETVDFYCGDTRLCGYLYRADSDKLVVLIPGHRAGADDYLWQIDWLVEHGYAVFAFDATGTCRSEGRSAVGFSQIVYDLRAALDHLETNARYGYSDLYLFGHSRGGYAACTILDEGYDIAAVVTVSGVNSCMEAIMQPMADAVGGLAYINYPLLWMYQRLLFDADLVRDTAADCIDGGNTPVLIVQGSGDDRFTEERYSIYAHAKQQEIGNAAYYLCDTPDRNGHTDLLFDEDNTANESLMQAVNSFFEESKCH